MNSKPISARERSRFLSMAEKHHRNDKYYTRRANLELVLYVAIVLIIALAVRTFIFEPIMVIGPSMDDTLLHGERMFVEKVSYWFTPPKRGDIIICYYEFEKLSCVKRVIALPGETISIVDGKVYIDGEELDESAYWNDEIFLDMMPQKVPENCVFVMGDNRNLSEDSRSERVGPIPYKHVLGRARYVIWPLSGFRRL